MKPAVPLVRNRKANIHNNSSRHCLRLIIKEKTLGVRRADRAYYRAIVKSTKHTLVAGVIRGEWRVQIGCSFA
jgi:hypothetical protein